MHRVLSFQMARGFGESSEFVTKRMCFSFLFCVAFLSLLGGFLLGRFSAQRNGEIRAERKRQEWAGNGLESTGHLQQLLIEELQRSSFFDESGVTDSVLMTGLSPATEVGISKITGSLSRLDLFNEIEEKRKSVIATIQGSREPDRWVVVSVSGDGTSVALELARVLAKLHVEQGWTPRRTLVLCFSETNDDSCSVILSKYFQPRIIAYLALHERTIHGNGCLFVAGSDVLQSTVLQAVDIVKNSNSHDQSKTFAACTGEHLRVSPPRLQLDISHVSLSFVANDNIDNKTVDHETEISTYHRTLAQIMGVSVWRLSDSLLLHWEPTMFENNVESALNTIQSSQFDDEKEKIIRTLEKLVKRAQNLCEKMDNTTTSDLLTVRMTNDLLTDLDRALLCPDAELRSRTDLSRLSTLPTKSASKIAAILEDMRECYENALNIFHET